MFNKKITLLVAVGLMLFMSGCANTAKAVVSSISIDSAPTKLYYNLNEQLDLTGGIITVNMSDQSSENLPMTNSLVTTSGFNNLLADVQEITVAYNDHTTKFSVYVGYKLLHFQTGTDAVIESAYHKPNDVITVAQVSKQGYTFEGWYTDSNYTQLFDFVMPNNDLTVYARFVKVVSAIEIHTAPSKLYYNLNDQLDLTGGLIKFKYSDQTTENLLMTNSLLSVTGFDNTLTSIQEITVSYKGFKAKFSVHVGYKRLSLQIDTDTIIQSSYYKPNTPITIGDVSKSGYTFEGWYTDSNYAQPFNFVMPNNDLTILARFIEGDNVKFVGGNSQYLTILSAIEASAENGIVFVRAGSYTETFAISKGVTLLGNNYDIIGTGQRRAESTVYPVSAEGFNAVETLPNILIQSSNVVFSGFKLDGDNPNIQNLLTEQMRSIFANKASNGWWSYNREGLVVGQDLHTDGHAGIGIFNSGEHFNGIEITNNIITNFNNAGIDMSSPTKASTGVNAIISGNYISNMWGYGETKAGVSYGCYGNGILASGVMNVYITNNKIENTNTGVHYTHIYGFGNAPYVVSFNEFVNTSTAIWINSNDGAVPGVTVNVHNNIIWHDDNYIQRIELNTLKEKGIANNYGIVITSINNATKIKINIYENEISNMRFGVVTANVPENVATVYKNTFRNLYVGSALVPEFTMYVLNANNYMIAYDNILIDCEYDHRIYEVGSGKVAVLYTLVEIRDGNTVLGTVKVKIDHVVIESDLSYTKPGYTFDGWYEDAELTVPYDFNQAITTQLKNVIYSKWILN